MQEQRKALEGKYHRAVVRWQEQNFPQYEHMQKQWEKNFPKEEAFCLCAKLAQNGSATIEVGEHKGQPKAERPCELDKEAAQALLAIIRAQASTEFGSIQQHQKTVELATDPQDQAWVMRVMAEELRHGYQMLHLLTDQDWSGVTPQKPAEMVEEILSMQTGSHVLAAFNLEYDSFVDNVVFAAFIDRVGKYQLTMQKVNAYAPMANSMPPMLKEEAFHLAAGVIPMRRWAQQAGAASGDVSMQMLQQSINKWYARGLEMFGDERGGESNIRLGLKDMANREAQIRYIHECEQMLDDINRRFVRARKPELKPDAADTLYAQIKSAQAPVGGITPEELLHLPHPAFFRRRGEHAYTMTGITGEHFDNAEAYIAHVLAQLPEVYAKSADVTHWALQQRGVGAGTIALTDAIKSMPQLARTGGSCACASSVRWVQ